MILYRIQEQKKHLKNSGQSNVLIRNLKITQRKTTHHTSREHRQDHEAVIWEGSRRRSCDAKTNPKRAPGMLFELRGGVFGKRIANKTHISFKVALCNTSSLAISEEKKINRANTLQFNPYFMSSIFWTNCLEIYFTKWKTPEGLTCCKTTERAPCVVSVTALIATAFWACRPER